MRITSSGRQIAPSFFATKSRSSDVRAFIAAVSPMAGARSSRIITNATGAWPLTSCDLPMTAEIYVHRIGRTARAGAAGIATTFCDHDERSMLRDIERLTRQRLNVAEHNFAIKNEPMGARAARADSQSPHRPTGYASPGQRSRRPFGKPQAARRKVTGQARRFGRRLSTV